VNFTDSAAAVAPSIAAQPASQTVTEGQTASFSVAATGTAPLSYQWGRNGTVISGATASSYTTQATSAATVAPSITTQPTSQTVTAGQKASFSSAGGDPTSDTPSTHWKETFNSCMSNAKHNADHALVAFKQQQAKALQNWAKNGLLGGAAKGAYWGARIGLLESGTWQAVLFGGVMGAYVGGSLSAGGTFIGGSIWQDHQLSNYMKRTYQPFLQQAVMSCAAQANTTPPAPPPHP
jgi:hypothetical protein